MLSICGPAWIRTRLKHSFLDLKNDERLMNFDEKKNDPFLLNLVLINLSEICFFPQDTEIAEDCVNVGIIYSNEAWKNSVRPYAKCSFSSPIMKENQQISCYLQKYAELFEMETYLFRKFSLSQIKKLGNGQWRKIPPVVKSNIKKFAENSRKKSSRQLFLRMQSILNVILLAHKKTGYIHF